MQEQALFLDTIKGICDRKDKLLQERATLASQIESVDLNEREQEKLRCDKDKL